MIALTFIYTFQIKTGLQYKIHNIEYAYIYVYIIQYHYVFK